MRNIYIVVFLISAHFPQFAKANNCPSSAGFSVGNLQIQSGNNIITGAPYDPLLEELFPRLSLEKGFLGEVNAFVKTWLTRLSRKDIQLEEDTEGTSGQCRYKGSAQSLGGSLSAEVFQPGVHNSSGRLNLVKLEIKVPVNIRHISKNYPNAPGYVDVYLYLLLSTFSSEEVLPANSAEDMVTAHYGFHSNNPESHIFEGPIAYGNGADIEFDFD